MQNPKVNNDTSLSRMHNTVSITRLCPLCGEENEVIAPESGYYKWRDEGVLIQDAMPSLNASEREIIKTGICDPCWESTISIVGEEF